MSDEVTRFADLIRDADPGARVPTCPRWRLRDLVHHTGAIHRWAAGLVAARARRNRRIADTDDWVLGDGWAEQVEWLAAAHGTLLPTLRAAGPNVPMWAWGGDQHVRFWSRRMAHETAVHRVDAAIALGRQPWVDSRFAADGVGEFLANLWRARAWRWNIGKLRGAGETITLIANDTADQWTITLTDTGFGWSHDVLPDQPHADVTVRAAAVDLYLLAWRRRRIDDDRFDVRGDLPLLQHWHRNTAV